MSGITNNIGWLMYDIEKIKALTPDDSERQYFIKIYCGLDGDQIERNVLFRKLLEMNKKRN